MFPTCRSFSCGEPWPFQSPCLYQAVFLQCVGKGTSTPRATFVCGGEGHASACHECVPSSRGIQDPDDLRHSVQAQNAPGLIIVSLSHRVPTPPPLDVSVDKDSTNSPWHWSASAASCLFPFSSCAWHIQSKILHFLPRRVFHSVLESQLLAQ